MKRLSRKALQEHASDLVAFRLSSNIYKYDNDLSALYELKKVNENDNCYDGKLLNAFIDRVKLENPDSYRVSTKQLWYSAGTYGCSGQMHKLEVLDRDYNVINTYFTYCC